MNERLIKIIAATGFISGGVFGIVGSFVSSSSLRGLAWGIDGIGIILASALLTVYYFRKGYDIATAGFLILTIGEAFILSCSATNPEQTVSTFGTGTCLWSASLSLISSQKLFPILIRCIGFIAAILFAIVSVMIFIGRPINPLTEPLPFYAYPFFAVTLFGWAWTLFYKTAGIGKLNPPTR